jgi:hypothetical protein
MQLDPGGLAQAGWPRRAVRSTAWIRSAFSVTLRAALAGMWDCLLVYKT